MTRKQLQAHRETLQPLLRKRTPVQFDTSVAATKLKAGIQAWNRDALRLLKGTPGGRSYAASFEALGRMTYGTLVDVRKQLRSRQDVIDQFLGGTPPAAKPKKAALEQVKAPAARRTSRPARPKTFEFDVCLSFAGEDRPYVKGVYDALTAAGIKVFYDFDEDITAELWGKDLYVDLDEVYRKRARFCIMFLSRHYARKVWTNHERESAQARAFVESEAYILPIRLDATEIPGIRPTQGYLSKSTPLQTIVNSMLKKLGRPVIAQASTSAKPRNPSAKPRTPPKSKGSLSGHVVLLGDRLYQAEHVRRGHDRVTEVELTVRGEEDRTALRALDGGHVGYRKVRFVDRLDAMDVQAHLMGESTKKGVSVISMKLTPVGDVGSGMRISFAGEEPGSMVERRLRQLLLGEAPSPSQSSPFQADLPLEVQGGVLPYARQLARHKGEALQLAERLAVYFIRSLNVVDTIAQLQFKQNPTGKVSVSFKGTLSARYSNEAPVNLNFTGTLSENDTSAAF